MCTAVEESTQHSDCKAITFSSTVFDDLPMMTSVTVFEKLPAFTSKLVYEDASNSLIKQDEPVQPQLNDNPHVPPSDKVHVTKADLIRQRKRCDYFEKNTAPNMKELKEFVLDMMEMIKQMAIQYPEIFSVKPDCVLKPGLIGQLTHGDLEDHQERWENIIQTLDITEMKEHMLEAMKKLERIVVQIEHYRKEMETLQENVRQMEVMNEQKESLVKMYPGVSKM